MVYTRVYSTVGRRSTKFVTRADDKYFFPVAHVFPFEKVVLRWTEKGAIFSCHQVELNFEWSCSVTCTAFRCGQLESEPLKTQVCISSRRSRRKPIESAVARAAVSAVRVGCVSLQFVPSYLRAVSKDIKKSEKKVNGRNRKRARRRRRRRKITTHTVLLIVTWAWNKNDQCENGLLHKWKNCDLGKQRWGSFDELYKLQSL